MLKEIIMNVSEGINKKDFQELMDKTELEAENMVVKTWSKFTPSVVNNGFCDIFADNFIYKFKGAEYWNTYDSDGGKTYGHVWVKYKGKYYDAETPNGVKDYADIPYIKRATKYLGNPPQVHPMYSSSGA